jgi:hypothetical protein
MSCSNSFASLERTSLNVYEADIFNCSRQMRRSSDDYRTTLSVTLTAGVRHEMAVLREGWSYGLWTEVACVHPTRCMDRRRRPHRECPALAAAIVGQLPRCDVVPVAADDL